MFWGLLWLGKLSRDSLWAVRVGRAGIHFLARHPEGGQQYFFSTHGSLFSGRCHMGKGGAQSQI